MWESHAPPDVLSGQSAISNRQSAIRIGTRGSKLALTQTRWVADALMAAHPGLACEMVHITTTGDRQRTQPLPAIGGKGLFTKELEEALLRGDIDLAVHSLKDLPTRLPDGLVVAAVPERAPANDALITPVSCFTSRVSRSPTRTSELETRNAEGVTRHASSLDLLPQHARIGTSSPRRAAQLGLVRPDLVCLPLRGNLDTRLRKLAEGQADAIVLALAGLVRLGLAVPQCQVASGEWQVAEPTGVCIEAMPFDLMLPAPGQGALAVEARAGSEAAAIAAAIADPAATAATTAERALLDALGGGCSMPLGAYAEIATQEEGIRGQGTRTIGDAGDTLRLRAILFTPDGATATRADITASSCDPVGLARAVAQALR